MINGLTYLAVLIGLARMRQDRASANRRTDSWIEEIREGIGWVRGNSKARVFLTLVMITSVFGLPYTILLPVFARDILEVGSRGLGFMTGATGLGAMVGALYLAGRETTRSRGGLIAAAMGLLGASLIAFSFSRSFVVSMGLLVLTGAAMIAQLASSNTLLQLLAPPELRGRVVGFFMLAFMGMAPLGSLLAGVVARRAGTPTAVLIGGGVCLVTAVWFATRLPALRRAARARDTEVAVVAD
jgi:predicted MFS family arabinose efflux permease